jgi:hypothetical protein
MKRSVFFLLLVLFVFGCKGVEKPFLPVAPAATRLALPSSFSIGESVTYRLRRYVKYESEDRPKYLSEGIVKISITGKALWKDNEFYWVEYVINDATDQQRVFKFMVDEKGNPQPFKLIIKFNNMQAVEIELKRWEVRTRLTVESLFYEMTRSIPPIPFTQPEHSGKKEKDKVQINVNGKEDWLKCDKVNLIPDEDGYEGAIWYAPQLPFAGLVKALLYEENYRTQIILMSYQTSGAETVITEQTKRLDFQE